MDRLLVKGLIGKQLIGQHGREVGVVTDMTVDVTTWQVQSLELKLNRATLDDLNLKRSWIGTQTIQVPTTEISGASDTFVLKQELEEMEFSGGKPAAPEKNAVANESAE